MNNLNDYRFLFEDWGNPDRGPKSRKSKHKLWKIKKRSGKCKKRN